MSPIVTTILVASNLGLIFLLMSVPLGLRTIRLSRVVAMDQQRLWQALWPLGSDASWSGEILSAEPLDGEGMARIMLSWEGRDGKPIERKSRFEDVVEGSRFSMIPRSTPRSGRIFARPLSLFPKAAARGSRLARPIAIAALPSWCSAISRCAENSPSCSAGRGPGDIARAAGSSIR